MEARVRALTREIGTLKEDLKRETKRKDRAVARCKECEETLQLTEQEAKELRYSNKKLADDLACTRESSRQAAANNHKAIQSLQDGLSSVEQAVGQRAAQSYEKMQTVYSAVQKLQGALFLPGGLQDSAAPAVQACFAGLLQQLSNLSGQLASGTDGLASMLGSAGKGTELNMGSSAAQPEPSRTAPAEELRIAELRAENDTLRHQLGHLQAQEASREAVDPALLSTVAQVESLIPHYRQALEKLKNQAFIMKDRLEQAAREKKLHAQQVADLNAALRERDTELQAKEAEQAEATAAVHHHEAQIIAVSTEAETSRMQLEGEMQELHARCEEAESMRVATCKEYESRLTALKRQIAEEQRRQEEQQAHIAELQGRLSEQQIDIKAALDLVLSRRTVVASSHGRSSSPRSQSPTMAEKKLAHHISQRMSSSTAPPVPSIPRPWPVTFDPNLSVPSSSHQGQRHRVHHPHGSNSSIGGGNSSPQRGPPAASVHPYSPKVRSSLSTGWPHRNGAAAQAPLWPPAKPQSYGDQEQRERGSSTSLNLDPSTAIRGVDMAQLRHEMASLDCEIAGLETSLKEAASKFM